MTNEEFATLWETATNQELYDAIVEAGWTPEQVIEIIGSCEKDGYIMRRDPYQNQHHWLMDNFPLEMERFPNED